MPLNLLSEHPLLMEFENDGILREQREQRNHQMIAMISSFSTAFNIVNVSLVLPILSELIVETSSYDDSMVASVVLVAMMIGQLGGGYLGDTIGALPALRLVMMLQVVGSLLSSLAILNTRIYEQIAAYRFILGIGCGGVYPLSAVLLSNEASDSDNSMHKIIYAFSMQGVGLLAVPLLSVPLLYLVPLEVAWRILLGIGALPGVILLCMSRSLPQHPPGAEILVQQEEEERAEEEINATTSGNESDGPDEQTILDSVVDDSIDGESRDTNYNLDDPFHTSLWEEPRLTQKLAATAITWFLFDVLFYGNTLFQPIVLEAALGKPGEDNNSSLSILRKTATDSLILTLIELPGFAVAATVIGKQYFGAEQSPRHVMMQGFSCMAILYLIIGTFWHRMRESPVLLVALYGLTFFFSNYGPNTVTFFLPALMFGPRHRSTWNGIAAASGKLGAVIGASCFAPVASHFGPSFVMIICSVVGLVAAILTGAFVPRDLTHHHHHHTENPHDP